MRRSRDEKKIPNPEGVRASKYVWVRANKILVPKSDDELDDLVVSEIAESIKVCGLVHPIAVRRVTEEDEDGGVNCKIVLVFGAHRLQAMKYLGQKSVPCVFVECDERQAQLVRLGENLWRKTFTVLQRAEMTVEYLHLASAKLYISGQPGQKSKRGRPAGGISLAARELPTIGRSVEARRKIIGRFTKIAAISPEAKEAAKKARLDNNQGALLKIAKAGTRKAQVRKVAELAQRSQSLKLRFGSAHANAGGRTCKAPPLQPGIQPTAISAKSATTKKTPTSSPGQETTLDEMEAFWKRKGRKLWAYLPFRDRERFIEMLRRARCKAQVDVVAFVRDAFRGRAEIEQRDLYAFAATRGLAKGVVRNTIKALGYPAKRKGWGSGAVWYFRNIDRDWKEQLRCIADEELKATREAQPDPVVVKPFNHDLDMDEYLADI
jgi:ParB-like chromosome segregation protein Spo0J